MMMTTTNKPLSSSFTYPSPSSSSSSSSRRMVDGINGAGGSDLVIRRPIGLLGYHHTTNSLCRKRNPGRSFVVGAVGSNRSRSSSTPAAGKGGTIIIGNGTSSTTYTGWSSSSSSSSWTHWWNWSPPTTSASPPLPPPKAASLEGPTANTTSTTTTATTASDVLWPSLGAFLAMAVLGRLDHLMAPKLGVSFTIAPLGAVCAVLLTAPNSPAAQRNNMFVAQITCAAFGVLALSVFGPGWLARSIAVAASIAFMLVTRATHPPAASLPILFIDGAKFHQLQFWYMLFPGAAGCIILCLIQELVLYLKSTCRF